MVCYSHLFKYILQFVVIHTVEDFGIVNEAEIGFSGIPFFYDPTDVANLISGSSVSSKPSLSISKFLAWALLKPSVRDSECASM